MGQSFLQQSLHYMPRMTAISYEVVLFKEGYADTNIYLGTLEECRAFARAFRKGKQTLWHKMLSTKEVTYLRGGYYTHILRIKE